MKCINKKIKIVFCIGRKYIFPTLLLPYSLRNGSMVMAKKIMFEIIAESAVSYTHLEVIELPYLQEILLFTG